MNTRPDSGEGAVPTTNRVDAAAAADFCDTTLGESTGPITDSDLVEISGVAASREHPGVLWVHNDSGAPNAIWAIDGVGNVLGRFGVTGAHAVDWEDIALGAGPEAGRTYLYVADTGDNLRTRAEGSAKIYRFPEPDPEPETAAAATLPATAFTVAFEDGAHDAEAIIPDPLTNDVFVISKQWDDRPAGIYRLASELTTAEDPPAGTTTMNRVDDVAGTAGMLVTGADISADGTLVALRTYRDVLLWDRDPELSVAETLARPPSCTRGVRERQGEAIAIGPDRDAIVTISEGSGVMLNWLQADAQRR